jgi:hypothetical protein
MRFTPRRLTNVVITIAGGLIVGLFFGQKAYVYATCYDDVNCVSYNIACSECADTSNHCGYNYIATGTGLYAKTGGDKNWAILTPVEEDCFTRQRCHRKHPLVECSGGDEYECEVDPDAPVFEGLKSNNQIFTSGCE